MYKHILAATDFSDLGDRALQKATELAVELGAKLTFVHVMASDASASPMYAQHEVKAHVEKLEASKAAMSAKMPGAEHIEVEFEVRIGEPANEILAAMEQLGADLCVISTNGERGFSQWLLGTTTDRVVRGSRRDVLVVT
jgi:nucleotide-binding universal stress UspA family protein